MKFLQSLLVILMITCGMVGFAKSGTLPNVLHYQATLYDDGGNVIEDGPVGIAFRIIDLEGNVFYRERQTSEVIRGAVAVMIGNGVDPETGSPTGGLADGTFQPGKRYFLEVEVDGFPAAAPAEIVSVPYALYADHALSLAEKAITLDHFAEGTLAELSTALMDESLLGDVVTRDDVQSTYSSSEGAGKVGVASGLTQSSGANVQRVLSDFDSQLGRLQTNINAVQSSVSTETAARISANNTLQSNVDAERTGRISADNTLQSSIDAERNARTSADNTLQGDIGQERSERQQNDAALVSSVNANESARQGSEAQLRAQLNALLALPQVRAWGRLIPTPGGISTSGYNFSASRAGSSITVSFSTSLPSNDYSLLISPRDNYFLDRGVPSARYYFVDQADANGFRINNWNGVEVNFAAIY